MGRSVEISSVMRGASIRRHLSVLLGATLLPLVIGIAVVFWSYSQAELDRQKTEVLATARRLANVVDRELDGFIAALQGLSASNALRRGDWEALDAQARRLAALRGSAVSLRRADGQQLINTYVPFGTPLPVSTDPVLRQADMLALRTGEPVVSDLYVGAVAKRYFVLAMIPVEFSGERGLLNIAVAPERLAELIGRGLPAGHVASIRDGNSRVIARFPEHETFVGTTSSPDLLRLLESKEGVWQAVRMDNVDALGAHTTLPRGWQVLTSIPTADIRRQARIATVTLSAITLGVVAISLLLGGWIARRLSWEIRSLQAPQRMTSTQFNVLELEEVAMQLDASDRAREEVNRHRSHLAAIVSSSNDAIITIDDKGRIVTWNDGAVSLTSSRPEEVVGRDVRTLLPADQGETVALWTAAAFSGRHVRQDSVLLRRDGSLVDVSISIAPIAALEGEPPSMSLVAFEITDRKQAEQQREFLMRELDHRLKNVFATMSSLIGLTARSAKDISSYAAALRERVHALSAVHDLVRGAGLVNTISLGQIVDTVDAAQGRRQSQFHAAGPDVQLSASGAISIGMVLNELVTNALKYGALSTESGVVDCRWDLREGQLTLIWRERNGPRTTRPCHTGFGSMMIQQSIAHLDGEVEFDWAPTGLAVKISLPLGRLGDLEPLRESA